MQILVDVHARKVTVRSTASGTPGIFNFFKLSCKLIAGPGMWSGLYIKGFSSLCSRCQNQIILLICQIHNIFDFVFYNFINNVNIFQLVISWVFLMAASRFQSWLLIFTQSMLMENQSQRFMLKIGLVQFDNSKPKMCCY